MATSRGGSGGDAKVAFRAERAFREALADERVRCGSGVQRVDQRDVRVLGRALDDHRGELLADHLQRQLPSGVDGCGPARAEELGVGAARGWRWGN